MCVTNTYVDRYPDGREVEFRKLSTCQYGAPGRPCPTHSTMDNPVRKIQFGEPTTEYMLTQPVFFPPTPPRSSGGSHHRHSGSHRLASAGSPATSEEGSRRRHSKRLSLKPTRTHRKERIIIVDAPPTPRTPPQIHPETFTAPSSPIRPFASPRSRPIIVDERHLRRSRATSIGAVAGDRRRSRSRPRHNWDTPSSSHTSFDLRAEREREQAARRRQSADAELDEEIRRQRRIRAQDDEIRRRPAVPIPPRPLGQRAYLRPVVDQSQALQGLMGNLSLSERTAERALVDAAAERRRLEVRDRQIREKLEATEQEAMRQRLRERQMPRRRFSVATGERRHRVLYDDGVYRWE